MHTTDDVRTGRPAVRAWAALGVAAVVFALLAWAVTADWAPLLGTDRAVSDALYAGDGRPAPVEWALQVVTAPGLTFFRAAVLLPVLFLTGLTVAPTLIMQQAVLDQLVPPARLNEAQAFLSASNTAGAALGTAVAGVVIDVAGLSWSFGGAALGVAAAAVVARLSRRGRDR